MGRKRIPGLSRRAGIWHIDKQIFGQRVCQSTGTGELEEAERYLARLMEQIRQAQVYGVRPSRTFEEAAAKFVLENQHKRSINDDVRHLKELMAWIGNVPVDRIHRGTLSPWVEHRQRIGKASGTINHGLKVVRRILNLAAGEWVDNQGLTWLHSAPKIRLLSDRQKRQPYPLSWNEQRRLFRELPDYLADMAIFAVNTGCRDQEVCSLRWEWEVTVPELGTSVFIVPGTHVKNSDDRLIVLNAEASNVIAERRGSHPEYVFTYRGRRITRMITSAWKRARFRADLPTLRVHDLKHTFGRRLRAAGVSFEDRQDLLGHRSSRITTHYSAAELANLIAAAEKVSEASTTATQLVVLKGKLQSGPAKVPQTERPALTTPAKPLKSLVSREGIEPSTT